MYLQALVLEKGGCWEDYLSSAQHTYNMSIHAALKASPFSVLYGLPNPNSPINSAKFNSTPLYGENVQHDLANRLRQARALAKKNNMKFREDYEKKFNEKVVPHEFSRGHLVYLHRPELLKFEKNLTSPWFGPHLILDIIYNNALIQDLGSKKTRFFNLNRLRMYDVSPEEWKKIQLIKETKNHLPEILDDNDKPQTKKLDPDIDYATFDLREDIVCLNPDAATTHRPQGIKVEHTTVSEHIHPSQTAGSTSQNGTSGKTSSSFLHSLSEGLDKTFGISTESQEILNPSGARSKDFHTKTRNTELDDNTLKLNDTSHKKDTPKLNLGKGSSTSKIRVANLPSEQSGRITREKARNADLSIPPVFGDFWHLNQSKK